MRITRWWTTTMTTTSIVGTYESEASRGLYVTPNLTLAICFYGFVRKRVPFILFLHVRQARGSADHVRPRYRQDKLFSDKLTLIP